MPVRRGRRPRAVCRTCAACIVIAAVPRGLVDYCVCREAGHAEVHRDMILQCELECWSSPTFMCSHGSGTDCRSFTLQHGGECLHKTRGCGAVLASHAKLPMLVRYLGGW